MISYYKISKDLKKILSILYKIQREDKSKHMELIDQNNIIPPNDYSLSLCRRTGGGYTGASCYNQPEQDDIEWYINSYIEIKDGFEGWHYKNKHQQSSRLDKLLPWSLAMVPYIVQIIQIFYS